MVLKGKFQNTTALQHSILASRCLSTVTPTKKSYQVQETLPSLNDP